MFEAAGFTPVKAERSERSIYVKRRQRQVASR
jgi:hypothetical protein